MIATQANGDKLVVTPEGKLTTANAQEFRKELLGLVEDGNLNIVIDLKNVDILDSQGLAVFIMCHKSLSERSGTLTVVTENADFRGLFEMMNMNDQFNICSPEALG